MEGRGAGHGPSHLKQQQQQQDHTSHRIRPRTTCPAMFRLCGTLKKLHPLRVVGGDKFGACRANVHSSNQTLSQEEEQQQQLVAFHDLWTSPQVKEKKEEAKNFSAQTRADAPTSLIKRRMPPPSTLLFMVGGGNSVTLSCSSSSPQAGKGFN